MNETTEWRVGGALNDHGNNCSVYLCILLAEIPFDTHVKYANGEFGTHSPYDEFSTIL